MNKRLWLVLIIALGGVARCGAMVFEEDDEETTKEQAKREERRKAEFLANEKLEKSGVEVSIDPAKDLTYQEAVDLAWIALNSGVNEKFINALHNFDIVFNKRHGESPDAQTDVFVELVDKDGYTPFLRAVKNGSKDIVVTLLGRSNTDAQAKANRKNALEIIAQEVAKNPSKEKKIEYAEIVPILMRANVPLTDFFKSTARNSDEIKNALTKTFGNTKSKQLLFGGANK